VKSFFADVGRQTVNDVLDEALLSDEDILVLVAAARRVQHEDQFTLSVATY